MNTNKIVLCVFRWTMIHILAPLCHIYPMGKQYDDLNNLTSPGTFKLGDLKLVSGLKCSFQFALFSISYRIIKEAKLVTIISRDYKQL